MITSATYTTSSHDAADVLLDTGETWSGVCPGTGLWARLMEWQSAGGVIAPHSAAVPSVADLRRRAYDAAGVTPDALAIAMWEASVEGRPEGLAAIQGIRRAIKERYPKA